MEGKKHYARLQRRADTLTFRITHANTPDQLEEEKVELKSLNWVIKEAIAREARTR